MISDPGRRGSDAVEPYLSKADNKGSPFGPIEGVKPGQPLSVAEAASEFRDSKGGGLERRDNKAASDGQALNKGVSSARAIKALAALGVGADPSKFSSAERRGLIAKLSNLRSVEALAGFRGTTVQILGRPEQISSDTLFKALASFAKSGEKDPAVGNRKWQEIDLYGIASRIQSDDGEGKLKVLQKQMNDKFDKLQKPDGVKAELLQNQENVLLELESVPGSRVGAVLKITESVVAESLPGFIDACIAHLKAAAEVVTPIEHQTIQSIVPLLPQYEKDVGARALTALKPGQGDSFMREGIIGGSQVGTLIKGLPTERLQRHLEPVGQILAEPAKKPPESDEQRMDRAFQCLMGCLTRSEAITPAIRMLLAAGDRAVIDTVKDSPKPDGKDAAPKAIATQQELRERALVNTLFLRYLSPALINSSNSSPHRADMNKLAVRFQKMCNQMTKSAPAAPSHVRGKSVGVDQADIDKVTYGEGLMVFARLVCRAGEADLSQPPAKPA